jgi:uncharacterized protein (DUF1330 family)
MAAYIIAEHKITDAAKFEEYRTKVAPMIAKHGGRYLTKAGSHVVLEKERAIWQPERVVIIESQRAYCAARRTRGIGMLVATRGDLR